MKLPEAESLSHTAGFAHLSGFHKGSTKGKLKGSSRLVGLGFRVGDRAPKKHISKNWDRDIPYKPPYNEAQ